jgi:hypothetical protein
VTLDDKSPEEAISLLSDGVRDSKGVTIDGKSPEEAISLENLLAKLSR